MVRAGELAGCRDHGAGDRPCLWLRGEERYVCNGCSTDTKESDSLIFGSQCYSFAKGAAVRHHAAYKAAGSSFHLSIATIAVHG